MLVVSDWSISKLAKSWSQVDLSLAIARVLCKFFVEHFRFLFGHALNHCRHVPHECPRF